MSYFSKAGVGKFLRFTAVSAAVAVSVAGCVTADDDVLFRNSLVMFEQGQKEQAYGNVKGLCEKFPAEQKFCSEAENFRRALYDEKMELVKQNLSQEPPVPMELLTSADDSIAAAEKYAVTSEELTKYKRISAEYRKFTNDAINAGKEEAQKAFDSGEYIEAYDAIASVKDLDKTALTPIFRNYSDRIFAQLKTKTENLAAKDEWRQAEPVLKKMAEIRPEDPFVKEYSEKAKTASVASYYSEKADRYITDGDLASAISYYTKAVSYPDATDDMKKNLASAKIKLIETDFQKGVELASQDMFKQSYDLFMTANRLMSTLNNDQKHVVKVPAAELNRYYDNMFFHGQKAKQAGAYGLSYFYYRMLSDLAPSYQGLLTERKDVEERILSRALKSIAVIPFKSPVNEPELGLQASSNIMQLLQKQLVDDVKIIERGALEVLLREYELAVAGNSGAASAGADPFKIKSADYLLMGDVLDSRTESNVQKSKRKDRVQVGTEKVLNIEWTDWEKMKAKAEKERTEIPAEPKKFIDKPVYDYAEYDVSFYEKFSFLSISYRVVETSQGRIVYSNTVQSQQEARDEATSGIDMGSYKVPMKVAKLPTDIELSNKVRKENIDKITSQIIEIFKDQDVKYIADAERLESANNLKEAVEMYANGIILMKKKKKDASALEDKAGKYLDVLAAN
ncbi:hypothetical protein [Seleniivibrio woodruffii]|uniref:hypothetical protein n=1 Tax=Seleniivibrio woodruffii TaxID=1078050 RepID=UPI002409A36B|nr:hypothetical protein [Seleniivibrio woodruffii]